MTISHSDRPGRGQVIIEVRDIWKAYGHIQALRGASLDIRAGEVLALLGDNGAGKSTLANMIAGIETPDSGHFLFDGTEQRITSVRQARHLGVEIVYQDLSQAPDLSVVENFFLGRELLRPGLGGAIGMLDRKNMRKQTVDALKRLGAQVPSLRASVQTLSGGQRQAVAVARAVMWAKTTIILDEPTAALGAKQTAMVYDVVRAAASEGLAVLIVSHDIPKMIDFADRLAIMRLGHVVEQMPTKDAKLMDVMTKMLTVINQSGAA